MCTENDFTTTLKNKLDGIEASATADQTDAEIKTAYENNSDTNAFTDAEKTKLSGIEASATADQTASEIVALVADQTIAPSEIDMDDSEKIKLGTGDDLQIYHDGTNSAIKNTTGDLYIDDAGGNIYIQAKAGEQSIVAFADGAVELYHDNSKKAEKS